MDIQRRIDDLLRAAFAPALLRVENESHRHNVPPGSETHFKVTLVAQQFAELSRIQRHRRVNQVLGDLLAGPVHALALHLYTPAEWAERAAAPGSPPCLGGERGAQPADDLPSALDLRH